MKHKLGIIYYALATIASVCLAGGFMVLSGGETLDEYNGNV